MPHRFLLERGAVEEKLRVAQIAGRVMSCCQFVQCDTQRVNVRAMINEPAAAERLFRAHVRASCPGRRPFA